MDQTATNLRFSSLPPGWFILRAQGLALPTTAEIVTLIVNHLPVTDKFLMYLTANEPLTTPFFL